MKLYIKQAVFSLIDRFEVFDEEGNAKYYVEGELFSWGKKLHVYDRNHSEVIYIQQKLFSLFLPKYHIFVRGQQIAEIVKELSFLKPHYTVDGLGWDIKGDFWSHEYCILRNDEMVTSISKKWFTWGDSYMLDIYDNRDELPALAVILAIDCVVAQQSKN